MKEAASSATRPARAAPTVSSQASPTRMSTAGTTARPCKEVLQSAEPTCDNSFAFATSRSKGTSASSGSGSDTNCASQNRAFVCARASVSARRPTPPNVENGALNKRHRCVSGARHHSRAHHQGLGREASEVMLLLLVPTQRAGLACAGLARSHESAARAACAAAEPLKRRRGARASRATREGREGVALYDVRHAYDFTARAARGLALGCRPACCGPRSRQPWRWLRWPTAQPYSAPAGVAAALLVRPRRCARGKARLSAESLHAQRAGTNAPDERDVAHLLAQAEPLPKHSHENHPREVEQPPLEAPRPASEGAAEEQVQEIQRRREVQALLGALHHQC